MAYPARRLVDVALDLTPHLAQVHFGDDERVRAAGEFPDDLLGERPQRDEPQETGRDALSARFRYRPPGLSGGAAV